MGGVKGTRYLLPIYSCSIRTKKMSKLKMRKSNKNYFRILKKSHAYLQAILKAHVKFQKDRPKTVGRVKGTRYLFPIHFCSIRASVAQLDAPSDWRPGGRGFNPRRGRQHSFVEIDHEIFSTVILSLPLIQEGQLSVSGERMCTILVNRLED